MSEIIKVVQFGLGPIGIEAARTILEKSKLNSLALVGAIDVDPKKVGKDLGEVLTLGDKVGITVSSDAGLVFRESRPDVVLHTTSSFMEKIVPQLRMCIESNVNVISSAEELFFPYHSHASLSSEIDALAKKHNVVVLGTGVNPGFVMDTLVLATTGLCKQVQKIKVVRIVDTSKRRLQLQQKTGVGLTKGDFEERKKTGTFGHIGLRESLLFLAAGLGWRLQRLEETLEPILADVELKTEHFTVLSGHVRGLRHIVKGVIENEEVISLDLQMDIAAHEGRDSIYIDGDPPIDILIRNGIFGDSATVAALVNAIPLVLRTSPGLKTMMDIPVPRAFKAQPVVMD